MDSVTAKFNKYELSEICTEFTSSLDPNQPVPPLPKYVGGSDAHLLIGIKNTNLDPVWIKTLPSGVAVYRSVFRDIWGSNLIFAGPHKTFTSVIRVCAISHSIVKTHPTARNDRHDGYLLMEEQGHGVVMDTELGVKITPTSGTVEQGISIVSVDDMLHYNDRLLGELRVKVADIDVTPSFELHKLIKNSVSEIVTDTTTRFGELNFRSLVRRGIQIELSPDTVQVLEND